MKFIPILFLICSLMMTEVAAQKIVYINAKSGLNVRATPDLNGDKIAKLEYATKVIIRNQTRQSMTVEDEGKTISGEWVEIIFETPRREEMYGFVFDGYLSKLKPVFPEEEREMLQKLTYFGKSALPFLKTYYSDEIILEYDRIQALLHLDSAQKPEMIELYADAIALSKKITTQMNRKFIRDNGQKLDTYLNLASHFEKDENISGFRSDCIIECVQFKMNLRTVDIKNYSSKKIDQEYFRLLRKVDDGGANPFEYNRPVWIEFQTDYSGYSVLGDRFLLGFLNESKVYLEAFKSEFKETDIRQDNIRAYRQLVIDGLVNLRYGLSKDQVIKELVLMLENEVLFENEKEAVEKKYLEILNSPIRIKYEEPGLQFDCVSRDCSYG
ncbi:MAG: SH3 domain-containing protein [Flavobacteriaceae bacterium]|jgi:hypothetical protein|nr:SH3 domain-containing protein [Flavobacteriaceae bacterium]MDA8900334.1 SH3 domain-containing protein [Flavobacteriaceae bacterium]